MISASPTLTTAPWSEVEGIGEKSRKVYWQLDCPDCGAFLSAGVAKNVKAVDDVPAGCWAGHRLFCRSIQEPIHSSTEGEPE